jgi:hypothetical protein
LPLALSLLLPLAFLCCCFAMKTDCSWWLQMPQSWLACSWQKMLVVFCRWPEHPTATAEHAAAVLAAALPCESGLSNVL